MAISGRFSFLALSGLLLATCYNPHIVDGGLKCNAGNPPCPSGYKCNAADQLCYADGVIPPTAGAGGSTGGMGGGGGGGDTGGSGAVCTNPMLPYGPFPGCTSPPRDKGCDPVCQSGCACNERCRLEGDDNTHCRAEATPFLQQYDACEPKDDRCRPGTICLQESKEHPMCGSHCYRHCRTDNDCPNAKCTIDVQFGSAATNNKVCSPPMDACSPFGQAQCSPGSMRPMGVFGCYVMSSTYPDIPICDCAGTTPLNTPCSFEHECVPGGECVLLGGIRQCRRVCRVGAPMGTGVGMGGCPPLMPTCTAFPGGSQFGYCH
jgi:hypothetical protein